MQLNKGSYRLQHADEREDAEQRVPSGQWQAKVEGLRLLGHNVRSTGDKSDVGEDNADYKRPVVGCEVHSDGGHKVTLDGQGQKARRRHEVIGEVGHEGRHAAD